MKIQCDVCEKGEAAVFCTADEAALCGACDHRVHHANKLASKHQRFSLLQPSAMEAALCDVCKERRALLFCQQDRAILCRECDDPIHSANELTRKHDRFLLTGIKLSATTALYTPPESVVSASHGVSVSKQKPPVKKSVVVSAAATTSTPTVPSAPTADKGGEPNQVDGSTSSISEYLMETLPGWHFEDFLDSSAAPPFGFSKADDVGLLLLEADLGRNLGTFPSENLELWVPQGPPQLHLSQMMNGFKETKEAASVKVNRLWTDDAFTVPQLSPPSSGFKRCRPFW